MNEKTKISENGITLIALVITIIVLLILAGVSIAMLTGENGILTKANEAKISTEIAEEKEKIKLSAVGALAKDNGGEIKRNYINDELTSYIGTEGTDYSLSESETAPFVVKYLDSGRSYLIDDKGNVSEYVDISEYVKVGDYVNYNPTVSDKNGTQQVESSKLTYISPTGSGTEHGNGYTTTEEDGEQKFTATVNTKWQVLDIENGIVTLISEDVIKTDAGSNFTMYGAIGYLYAEQELNEICKIYGYGYGADTSQVTQYTYGGPLDGNLTRTITNSGARSIRIEDINKKAEITEADYVILNNKYGSITNPISEVYFPTIKSEYDKDSNGISDLPGVKNLEYTYYSYNKDKITNTEVRNILFNGNYWLSSRSLYTSSDGGHFVVNRVYDGNLSAGNLCSGSKSNFKEATYRACAVRPVVSLKSNIIDTNTNYETEGYWNLK